MFLKRMLLTAAIMAMTPTVLATTAFAQGGGLYAGAGAGVSFANDSDVTGSGINTQLGLDTVGTYHGMFGYAFDNGFRTEVELGNRDSDVQSIGGATSSQGTVGLFHAMLNGYYDINTGTKFVPYVGAGLGVGLLDFDGINPIGGVPLNDSDTVFTYQGIAGVSYRFSERADVYADYRYMATSDANLTTSNNRAVESDFSDHRIMVGFRFYFGAPKKAEPAPTPVAAPAVAPPAAPPAPPPAPAPAPAPKAEAPRNYLVFFDFDQSTLTTDAQAIIRSAATAFREGKMARLEATGHADRAGPNAYNMRLSQRRAEAVKAELIRLGVPANQIGTSWKGEEQPLVQTPDGVREPQNRRVEIVLN